MSQIHPLTGASIGGQVQQRQIDEKDRQLRRSQNLSRNSALRGDRLEHEVESAEAPEPPHEHDEEDPRKRRRRAAYHRYERPGDGDSDDRPPHVDLRA
jgi:hypothetical protein